MSVADVAQPLRDTLAATGFTGWVHAVDIDGDAEVGVDPDVPVVAASVFKTPILVELARRFAAGEIDPRARVRVGADERRTPGGTGISVLLDDVELSVRDLAVSMMSVSDNRATDVVLDLVGLEQVNATMAGHGFPGTVLELDCAGLFATMDADLGGSVGAYLAEHPDGPLLRTMRAADPARTSRTTAREATGLLVAVWRDELFGAQACAEVRRVLGLQVWPHRLTSGFPEPGTRVSGKTGTIAAYRSEAGVVERPDGRRAAVAVFLRAPVSHLNNPGADRCIGVLGRQAVDAVLGPLG